MRIGQVYLLSSFLGRLILCIFIAGLCSPRLFADDADDSHQAIVETVARIVAEKLDATFPEKIVRKDIQVGAPDARLKLDACANDLHIALPPFQGYMRRTNAKVECRSNQPWSITLPVTIRAYMLVAVANNQLIRGHRIAAEDITLAEMDVDKLKQGYFTSQEPIVGMQLKRTLLAKAPFTPRLLLLPVLIQRGEQVTISAQSSSLLVKTNGIALSSGTLGQKIPIRNSRSERIVEGEITGPGQVDVNM